MYWLNGWDLPLKDILLPGATYKSTPECISEPEEALTYLSSPSISVKSVVMSDDYHLWSISVSKYVDEIIWIVWPQATWGLKDKTEGFSMCYDLFEWLDTVHAEWTTITTHQIYDIAHECYLKSLPADIVPPPSLSTLLNPLTPVPLGLSGDSPQVRGRWSRMQPRGFRRGWQPNWEDIT